MEKTVHLVDLDETLIRVDVQPWIIKKTEPNVPIIRLSISDRKLIESEFFKKDDLLIKYSGKEYWISQQMKDLLDKKAGREVKLTDYGVSYAEWFDPDLIKEQTKNAEFLINNVSILKNTTEDVMIVSDRANLDLHSDLIDYVKTELNNINVAVKNVYFISKNNLKTYIDDSTYDKIVLILEKMIGYKIIDGVFTDIKTDQYNKVSFYDNDRNICSEAKNIQTFLNTFYFKSEDKIKNLVLEHIKSNMPFLKIFQITNNEFNPYLIESVILAKPYRINKFNFFK